MPWSGKLHFGSTEAPESIHAVGETVHSVPGALCEAAASRRGLEARSRYDLGEVSAQSPWLDCGGPSGLQVKGLQVSAGRDDSGVMRAGLVAALAARRRRWAAAERGPLDIYMPLDAAQSMLLSRPTWLGGRRASSARPGGSGARGERVAGAGGLLVVVVMLGAEDGRPPAASLAAASLAPAHGRAWGMRTART